MIRLENFLEHFANMLWGNWLMYALLTLGLVCSISTGWIQISSFKAAFKNFFIDNNQNKNKKTTSVSGSQALITAIGSCVGSGNIVGVSTAILYGGAGALFWMWFAAFLGMATKFSEIVLGMTYRKNISDTEYVGGPMYYIGLGLKKYWLGSLVAILLFIQNASATLIQSNTISTIMYETFNTPLILIGLALGIITTYIASGGFIRLAKFAQKIVPFMALLYVGTGLFIILININQLPNIFLDIFQQAFNFDAATGATAGITAKEAMRYGIARGIYSNEAGEGTAAVIHSTSNEIYPFRQGLYGILEVFIDTIIICTVTGLTILIVGVNSSGTIAPTMVSNAFASIYPPLKYIVLLSLILFSFSSLMSQWYFGQVSLNYLKSNMGIKLYKLLFPILILIGSYGTVKIVWYIQDCALGLLIIPNIFALLLLIPVVRKSIKDFKKFNHIK
ncbi:MAG: alanine/glycine:cation symporter family protein [Filifactoraceae bacterium]